MYGTCKTTGFALLELLIVILIIAIIGAVVVPNMQQRTPRYEREQFIARLNTLLLLGWQQAVSTNKVHKVLFNFDKRAVVLEVATEKTDKQGEPVTQQVRQAYLNTSFTWPEQLHIKQFILQGYDEMSRFAGRATGSVWFYMVPEGLTQEVTINMVDKKEIRAGKAKTVGLVLNPFTAQFTVYDAFQQ